MPGLFGFFLKAEPRERGAGLLDAMSRCLQHFDGYSTDTSACGNAGLGVVDVASHVHQEPFRDPATGVVVALSGEVYGVDGESDDESSPRRHSQAELIAGLYGRDPSSVPARLNGDFNLAIYDPRRPRLLIANDRFGFKQLFFYDDDSVFMFAPEIKAFLTFPEFDKSLDTQGIADYFNYFHHLGDRTMFRRVKLLPPASLLEVSARGISLETYWRPRYVPRRKAKDMEECVATAYHLFRQSVERRIGQATRVLVPLSGGLDSRLILAAALECRPQLVAATYGYDKCKDHEIAKRVCAAAGLEAPRLARVQPDWLLEHAGTVIRLGECNFGNLGMTTQYGFAEQIGTGFDCFLNGIFGSKLSFGSPYFTARDLELKEIGASTLETLQKRMNGHRFESIMGGCASQRLRDTAASYRRASVEQALEETAHCSEQIHHHIDYFFLRNRIRRAMNAIDHFRFLYNDQHPFASYELFDFFLTLSPDVALNHRLYKEIFRRELPHLARIPWSATGTDLYSRPSRLQARLRALRPYLVWYGSRLSRGRLNLRNRDTTEHPDIQYRRSAKTRAWIRGLLLSERCLDRGYFRREGLRALLAWEEKGGSAFPEISKMAVFEIWARNFLD